MIRRIAAGVGLVLGLGFALPAAAQERSFDITDMDVVATVTPNGDMDVVERLTYSFDGIFHGGDRSLPDDDYYEIVDLQATHDGEPVVVIDPNPRHFSFDSPFAPITGVQTFEITYTVVGAVRVGPDVGELYWQFVGDDFPRVGDLNVTINVPPGTGELRAWAHGPLTGVVQPTASTVTLSVGNVPKETFVEARVAVPSQRFALAPSGEPRLATILEEEGDFIAASEREKRNTRYANFAAAPLAVGGLAIAFVNWRKFGREPPPPPDVGDYYREIPTDSPAVVQAIESFGTVSPHAFSATVVDLAQRGWLRIDEEREDRMVRKDKVDYRFTRTTKTEGELLPYENQVLWKLFERGPATTQEEVLDAARGDRRNATKWLNAFKQSVKDDFESKDYVTKQGCGPYLVHLLVIVGLGLAGFILLTAFEAVAGVALWVAGGVLLLLTGLLRQRTVIGARELAEVRGLRRFLKDFSRLDEAVSGDLILYERYLVYAVALGVSDELIAGLRLRVPEVAQPNSGFAIWYGASHGGFGAGGGDHLSGLGSIGSFASNLGTATSAAFSPPASSGGHGGGFSGGGGGGGGGGGAGAH